MRSLVMVSFCLSLAVPALGQAPIVKVSTVDASNLRAVRVDGKAADVRITTTNLAVIRTEVVLESRDASRLPACAQAELRTSADDGTLRVTVQQFGRKRCFERWTVEVPAGLAMDVTVDVGSIDANVRGGYGDVDAKAQVGRVELEIDGRKVIPGNEPGPSAKVQLRGDGPRLSLRNGVGNVRAVISTRDTP